MSSTTVVPVGVARGQAKGQIVLPDPALRVRRPVFLLITDAQNIDGQLTPKPELLNLEVVAPVAV